MFLVAKRITTVGVASVFALYFLVGAGNVALAWNLKADCSVAPGSPEIGQVVTWTATASSTAKPHQGHYEYSWSGSDGLSGGEKVVEKTYSSSGEKTAKVKVTLVLNSGVREYAEKTCQATVVSAPPVVPACSFTPSAGRTIVIFPEGKKIASNGSFTRLGPVSADISAGSYVVSLFSFDGYAGRQSVSPNMQGDERWFLEIGNDSAVVGASGSSIDLDDGVEAASRTDVVNSSSAPLILGGDGNVAYARHAYPNDSARNSLYPVCAALDKLPVLKITKQVVNTEGGVAEASDFQIYVKKSGTHVFGSPSLGSMSGKIYILEAGDYSIGEQDLSSNYTSSFYGDCSAAGAVTLSAGENKTCVVTNTYVPPGQPLSGSCNVNPASVRVGENALWSATASGGTDPYIFFSWGGSDGLSGSGDSISKTYSTSGAKTGSVTITSGSQSVTKECSVSVSDLPPPPSSQLSSSCSASVSNVVINSEIIWTATVSGGTGSYAYSWSGSDGLSGDASQISKIYGSSGTKRATVAVTSGSLTHSSTCEVDITSPLGGCTSCGGGGGGGGGFEQPSVTLLKQADKEPLAFVYLSQIPYTGFGDIFKVLSFLLGLLLWSIVVVYLIRSGIAGALFRRIKKMLGYSGVSSSAESLVYRESAGADQTLNRSSYDVDTGIRVSGNYGSNLGKRIGEIADLDTNRIPANLPAVVGRDDSGDSIPENAVAKDYETRSALVLHARNRKTLISEDALSILVSVAGRDFPKAAAVLDRVIVKAESKYVKEDGWILLNKEKIQELIGQLSAQNTHAPVAHERSFIQSDAVSGQVSGEAAAREVPTVAGQQNIQVIKKHDSMQNKDSVSGGISADHSAINAASLVRWIGEKNEDKLFSLIRETRKAGKNPEGLIRAAVSELDRVFRQRVEDGSINADPEIKSITASWSADEIEKTIDILLTTIDQSYHNPATGAKLAIIKLLGK